MYFLNTKGTSLRLLYLGKLILFKVTIRLKTILKKLHHLNNNLHHLNNIFSKFVFDKPQRPKPISLFNV